MSMKTITGTFINAQNAPVVAITGTLTLVLQPTGPANVSGSGLVSAAVSQETKIPLTLGAIPGGTTIWASDQLSPITPYLCQVVDTSNNVVWGPVNLTISGASPIDLSTLVPNSTVASSLTYNSGSISGSVGSTNIASAANFTSGEYILSADVIVTAVGSSPTLQVQVGWTDISGTARTKNITTGVVSVSDNPITQTITSDGSAAITVTQTLGVSTATWQTMIALTKVQ